MTWKNLFMMLVGCLLVTNVYADYGDCVEDQTPCECEEEVVEACEPEEEEEFMCGLDIDLCSIDTCEGWHFFADWLWWRVRRCDLDFAAPSTDVDGDPYHIGKIIGVTPEYSSGFRVGMFKQVDELDVGLVWTRLHMGDHRSHTAAAGEIAATRVPPFAAEIPGNNIVYTKGDYQIEYDVVDIQAGANLELTDCLNASLFTGFRLAYIDQEMETVYAENAGDPLGQFGLSDQVRQSVRMDGYGFYLGLRAGYAIAKSVDFLAGMSFGTMLGDFDRRYVYNSVDTGVVTEEINLRDKCWRLLTLVDVTIGIDYHICKFSGMDWNLGLGYEFHQYFNFSDFINLTANNNVNDVILDHHADNLGLDGMYLRLGATF